MTGRKKQPFNVRIAPKTRALIVDTCKEENITQGELIERAVNLYCKRIATCNTEEDKQSASLQKMESSVVNLEETTAKQGLAIERLLGEVAQLRTQLEDLASQPQTEKAKTTPSFKQQKTQKKKRSNKPKAATARGGRRGKEYLYNGKLAPSREHLLDAMPDIDSKQLNKSVAKIRRAIEGRPDKPGAKRYEPQEAITMELERLRG
jgi:hypothetical protein